MNLANQTQFRDWYIFFIEVNITRAWIPDDVVDGSFFRQQAFTCKRVFKDIWIHKLFLSHILIQWMALMYDAIIKFVL